jgi:FkbM family methyltransferase
MVISKIYKTIKLSKIINPIQILFVGIKKRYKNVSISFKGGEITSPDRSILLGGIYEVFCEEVYRFKSESKNPIIIDCGANIGLSVLYFKIKYPNAKIKAFEADPEIFKYLKNNVFKYFEKSDVEIHNKAVWTDNDGIYFRQEGGASGRIEKNDKSILIESIRLKEFIKSFESIDLLKMDIEGAECDVLMDCGLELKKCKLVFVEYHSFISQTIQLDKILKLFTDLGFRYYIKEASSSLHPFEKIVEVDNMDLQLNIFFYQ